MKVIIHTLLKIFLNSKYSWPSNNMGLNCKGPLTCGFFSIDCSSVDQCSSNLCFSRTNFKVRSPRMRRSKCIYTQIFCWGRLLSQPPYCPRLNCSPNQYDEKVVNWFLFGALKEILWAKNSLGSLEREDQSRRTFCTQSIYIYNNHSHEIMPQG